MPFDDRKLCVVHANCQGDTLLALLGAHRGFSRRYRVRLYTNYTRQPVSPDLLRTADVFAYQHLGPHWGPLASEVLLARLGPRCSAVSIPGMFFLGYWPLWKNDPDFNYSDLALDELIAKGLPRDQVLALYLKGTVLQAFSPWQRAAESLEHERRKEAHSHVKYVDDLWARHKTERLFHTINHPTKAMLRRVADAVLDAAGLGPLTDAEFAAAKDPYATFELPIHPVLANQAGLAFGGLNDTYNLYNRRGGFVAYAQRYVDCKLAGRRDFINYLQSAA